MKKGLIFLFLAMIPTVFWSTIAWLLSSPKVATWIGLAIIFCATSFSFWLARRIRRKDRQAMFRITHCQKNNSK